MARPEVKMITFTIDGRQVSAPENMMLADAAKLGDVEIPVFCYEPKLGQPVGACRMCLVEIEGIPKLQTGCSTPVKDGMVVSTQSAQVKDAQNGVVEFLLVNHPLDCPVCDKGGECPLQDISFGWGDGHSRVSEPKRHFRKPVELSPLVAIDRERCILCYRCARYSQEVTEDHQLVLNERGAHSYITTFDGHPYVAPFSGNIVELCPVGALTSIPYRFRARPWDIESSGTVCTLCPSQCNVSLTVRDDRVLRVLDRHNDAVDDGWLCDKGRFGYQSFHVSERITEPMIRDGGQLRAVSWERALAGAHSALARAGSSSCAIAGGQVSNEEAFLLAGLMRDALGSEHIDSLAAIDPRALHALADPALGAQVSDIDHADAVLLLGCEPVDDAPIFDLRIRKAVRRNATKLARAGAADSTLDSIAAATLKCTPGSEGALALALALALEQDSTQAAVGGELEQLTGLTGLDSDRLAAFARLLRSAGEDVVVIYGHRVLEGGAAAATALLRLAKALGIKREGARTCGLIGLPGGIGNARGLLEAGAAPGYDPGYVPRRREQDSAEPLDARSMAAALISGELEALYLLHADPLRSALAGADFQLAMAKATTVIAHADFLTDELREHADVIFPAESYAEKEGTVVHPDGRLQRLRPAIGRQGQTRAGWWVLAELAGRLGHQTGLLESSGNGAAPGPGALALQAAGVFSAGLSAAAATKALFEAVPIYGDLSVEEIGGRGVRWPERTAAAAFKAIAPEQLGGATGDQPPVGDAGTASESYRSLWEAAEVEHSPALRFLARGQATAAQPDRAPAKLEVLQA